MFQPPSQPSANKDVKRFAQKELIGVTLLFVSLVCFIGSFFFVKPLYLDLQQIKEDIVTSIETIELKTMKLERLQLEIEKEKQRKEDLLSQDDDLPHDISDQYKSSELITTLNSIMGKDYGVDMVNFRLADPLSSKTMTGIKIQPIIIETIMTESQVLPALQRFDKHRQLFSVKSVEAILNENNDMSVGFIVDTYYVGEVKIAEKK